MKSPVNFLCQGKLSDTTSRSQDIAWPLRLYKNSGLKILIHKQFAHALGSYERVILKSKCWQLNFVGSSFIKKPWVFLEPKKCAAGEVETKIYISLFKSIGELFQRIEIQYSGVLWTITRPYVLFTFPFSKPFRCFMKESLTIYNTEVVQA